VVVTVVAANGDIFVADGSIYDQRKIPLHLFTIGFHKPEICSDSWFLESNGKKVQWDFSPDHYATQVMHVR
jgi:hypothetical protein